MSIVNYHYSLKKHKCMHKIKVYTLQVGKHQICVGPYNVLVAECSVQPSYDYVYWECDRLISTSIRIRLINNKRVHACIKYESAHRYAYSRKVTKHTPETTWHFPTHVIIFNSSWAWEKIWSSVRRPLFVSIRSEPKASIFLLVMNKHKQSNSIRWQNVVSNMQWAAYSLYTRWFRVDALFSFCSRNTTEDKKHILCRRQKEMFQNIFMHYALVTGLCEKSISYCDTRQ